MDKMIYWNQNRFWTFNVLIKFKKLKQNNNMIWYNSKGDFLNKIKGEIFKHKFSHFK